MGQQVAQQVKPLNLTPAEMELLKKGLLASLAGEKPQYDIQQYGPLLQARAEKHAATTAAGEKEKSAAFRDAAAAEAGAVKTASGLVYRTLTPGTRAEPEGHRQGARPLPRHAHRTGRSSTARSSAGSPSSSRSTR